MKPRRLRIAAIASVATVTLATAQPALAAGHPLVGPPHEGWLIPSQPEVSAKAWILWDASTGEEIASSEADLQLPPASTTKMMTALLALEHGGLQEEFTVSRNATAARGFKIGLSAGETLTLGQLLNAMIVRSANDAAVAVAEAVAGSVPAFVDLMNEKAASLGLDHTHFANPNGLDQDGHLSSARDLLDLALAAYAQPGFAELVDQKEVVLPTSGTEPRRFDTTNRFLVRYRGANGVKTGSTPNADLVLVASAVRGGEHLFAVVAGSTGTDGHFVDAADLLDYGFRMARVSGQLGSAEENASLAAEARVQALTHLSSVRPPDDVAPRTVVRTGSEDLPSLFDAFAWFAHLLSVDGG
ncbi:MAG TPA: serine hydrolase [Acidimicrobiia bacterium]|jgi:D-alanyl-D-alanine carboxypeptidase (penicillin-binding protein 5/6)